MRYWAIRFTDGTEKTFRADEVDQIELLNTESVLFSRDGDTSILQPEDMPTQQLDNPVSNMSRTLVSSVGKTGNPLHFHERLKFALEREAVVGSLVTMPDGNEWLVVRWVDGVLYVVQKADDIKVFAPAVWLKSKNVWKWFENRPKREKRKVRYASNRTTTIIDDSTSDYPYPVKGETDRSGCCATPNAHICKDSETIMEHGFCKGCKVENERGELDVELTLDNRDKIRMSRGLNPIAPGTYPVFAEEQLLSVTPVFNENQLELADSAIGELLKRNSNNADEWKSAFNEAYESGKDITWREEDGTN